MGWGSGGVGEWGFGNCRASMSDKYHMAMSSRPVLTLVVKLMGLFWGSKGSLDVCGWRSSADKKIIWKADQLPLAELPARWMLVWPRNLKVPWYDGHQGKLAVSTKGYLAESDMTMVFPDRNSPSSEPSKSVTITPTVHCLMDLWRPLRNGAVDCC